MKLRLTKKLAECIDGVILTGHAVGDILDLPPEEARLLLAENWAVAAEPAEGERPALPASEARHEPIGDPPLTIQVRLSPYK